ncbi:hypothetical protein SAMN05444722_0777 [Rhodovulum sp. ES.010]|uniref:hypothetical protein n=1 Tax=Rhodovulum sp. ES.010 TaxID=1882821 RepID=UPI0009275EB8|nr:hypothetical protein [Rhodovulum sp. ES.010]SIO19448.1 hypothetical protein SAMN05444722_0777 [Rhodovulum sp. ES.010]
MPTDRLVPVLATALLLAAPTHAQDAAAPEATTENDFALACAFDRECYDAEACAETAYEMTVSGRVGGMGAGVVLARATLSAVSGDVEVFGTLGGGTLFLQGGEGAARHYLAVTDGAARYSLHMAEGPVAITYLGACE